MNNPVLIETNFTIPHDYRREFKLECGEYRSTIVIDRHGITMFQFGQEPVGTQSQILDWITESIMSARGELGV